VRYTWWISEKRLVCINTCVDQRKMLVCVNTGAEQRKAGAVYVHYMCSNTSCCCELPHAWISASCSCVCTRVWCNPVDVWVMHLYVQRQHWLCMYTRAGSASC